MVNSVAFIFIFYWRVGSTGWQCFKCMPPSWSHWSINCHFSRSHGIRGWFGVFSATI